MILAPVCALILISTAVNSSDPTPPPIARASGKVRQIIGHRGSCADRPENTLASFRRAIETGAHIAEVDVRTTKDGALVCLHDPDLARTSDGVGKVGDLTLAEIKNFDAGSKFSSTFKDERVPELKEVLSVCKNKIDVLIDLKENGDAYVKKIAADVREHGDPKRTILGVRSVEHAKQFRELLSESRQIGLIPTVNDMKPFADAGVKMIRLWPKWLADEKLVPRLRSLGLELHLGAEKGTREELMPLLIHEPESLSSDDPAQLIKTLAELRGKKN